MSFENHNVISTSTLATVNVLKDCMNLTDVFPSKITLLESVYKMPFTKQVIARIIVIG